MYVAAKRSMSDLEIGSVCSDPIAVICASDGSTHDAISSRSRCSSFAMRAWSAVVRARSSAFSASRFASMACTFS